MGGTGENTKVSVKMQNLFVRGGEDISTNASIDVEVIIDSRRRTT